MFRKIRILILLLVFATVALTAWRSNQRLTAWEHTIHVGVYPIAGDESPTTTRYIQTLNDDSIQNIAEWMQAETDRYGLKLLQPVSLRLAPTVNTQPPLPPQNPSAIEAMLWSMKIRWWAWKNDEISGPKPNIRLFVLFHDPERSNKVPHSVGLGKGQIGLIHAFADRRQHKQNAVVITHELLHIFGATDKYDLATLQPIYPQGYAEPEKIPRLPQNFAEIMAGRTPANESHAEIPASLNETIVGHETANEIGWLKQASKKF